MAKESKKVENTTPAPIAPVAPTATKPAEVKPVAPIKTIDELKAILKSSIESGNDALFNQTMAELAKRKSEIAKSAAEAARKEAEALSGIRQQVSTAIFQAVKNLHLDAKLAEVKALGFTYNLDAPDKAGVMVINRTVTLSVPAIKATRAGGTTGGGKSKDEYGMSLGEIFDKFATDEDKAKLTAADSNTKQWQVKVAVKKRALAEGKLVAVK